ncbi:MAG: hypothetical protein ABI641_03710 [Caldimonas sp.]
MTVDREPPGGGDAEHDPWLREALRHAPDAAAEPPATLRDAILTQARATARAGPTRSTRPAGPARPHAPWLALWDWLARPPVAAGFASFMAATLVGLMWWDRPIDEAMPSPPPLETGVPAAAPAAAARLAPAAKPMEPSDATPAPTPSFPPIERQAPVTTKEEKKSSSPRASPKPFPETEKAESGGRAAITRDLPSMQQGVDAEAVSKERSPVGRQADKTPPATMKSAKDARLPQQPVPGHDAAAAAGAATSSRRASPSEPGPRQPAAPEAGSPAASRDRPAEADPRTRANEALRARADGVADETTAARGGLAVAEPRRALGRLEGGASPALAQAPRPVPPPPAARTLAALLASLTDEGGRWSREIGDGASAAVDPALLRWLGEVEASARDGASADAGAMPQAFGGGGEAVVRLRRDGHLAAIVRVGDDAVTIERLDPASTPARTALAPAAAARLRTTLPPPAR